MTSIMDNTLDEILENFGGSGANDLTNIYNTDNDENEPASIVHSPYYSIADMQYSLKEFDSDFTILSLNAQSINAKISEIQILMHQLSESSLDIGAVCIQETWVPTNGDTSQLQLDGFKLIQQGYSTTTHGGLFIYVNSKYTSSEFISIKESTVCEALFVKLSGADLPKDIIVGNVYKPPHNNNNYNNINVFISEMRPVLDQLNASKLEVLCAGDFNIDLLKINEKEHYSNFLDMMIQDSFFSKNYTSNKICKT